MLDIKTMRAIGGLLARQARARAVEPDVMNNEIIDLAPPAATLASRNNEQCDFI